jgi:hypothetical protein
MKMGIPIELATISMQGAKIPISNSWDLAQPSKMSAAHLSK